MTAFTGEPQAPPTDKRTVFLVHGRYTEVNEALTDFLHSLDLRVIPWEEAVNSTPGGGGNPYVGDVLLNGMKEAAGIVVLFTGEERVQLDATLVPDAEPAELAEGSQPRPNVLIEAGMVLAAYPLQTLIVQFGRMRPASDLGGKHIFSIGNASAAKRNDLVDRLRKIGLEPKTVGNRYLTAGAFPIP